MRDASKKRRPLRFSAVIGETFILAGLAVFGYVVWQPWHTGITVQGEQEELSSSISDMWKNDDFELGEVTYVDNIPVMSQANDNETFAIMHVPAFGKRFSNVIAEGTDDWGVLHPSDKGIGRYSSTQQFGEVGNVAVAAHRSGTFIAPFKNINNLRIGDPIFVETPQGWYTYRYRSTEYVFENQTEVLNPFPHAEVAGDDRILTLTSCHPREWGSSERVIAYAVFEGFIDRADGPPEEYLLLSGRLDQKEAGSDA